MTYSCSVCTSHVKWIAKFSSLFALQEIHINFLARHYQLPEDRVSSHHMLEMSDD